MLYCKKSTWETSRKSDLSVQQMGAVVRSLFLCKIMYCFRNCLKPSCLPLWCCDLIRN